MMAAKHEPTSPADSPGDASHETGKVRDLQDYRAALEGTLPPVPLKDLLAAGGATVYVLTADATLLDLVRRAGGGQFPVEAVREWPQLQSAVDAGRCHIALIDADLLGKSLMRRLDELGPHSRRLVTLVAATRADSEQLIAPLSDRKIHRLLIKPASLGITKLLLESAVARWLQLREQTTAPEPVLVEERDRRGARRQSGGRWPAWLLATGLVSLLIGVLVVVSLMRPLWQEDAPAERAAAPPEQTATVRAPEIAASETLSPSRNGAGAADDGAGANAVNGAVAPAVAASPPQAPPDRFADLIERGRVAFAEGRLAEPPGDNALDYYLTILTVDPQHERARAELATVVNALFTQAESALLEHSLDTAAAALAHARRAEPTSARLIFLETQLERSRAAAGGQDSAAADRVGAELDSLLTLAEARLERGQLLTPAGDSAREYWVRAAALNADDERVLAVRAELVTAIVAAAASQARNGNVAQAEAARAAAAELGASNESLAEADRAIANARARAIAERQASLLERGRARLATGDLLAPQNDSALYYLSALRAENAQYPELEAAWAGLRAALEGNARTAFANGDFTAAEQWLDGLARVDPGSAVLRELGTDLAAARRQQEYLATAVPASELTILEYRPPAYPAEALRDGVQGWVMLEFIVGLDGRPRDIVVAEAEPPGRFEEEAIDAVRNYVYQPFELEGRMYERRVRLRLTFNLR